MHMLTADEKDAIAESVIVEFNLYNNVDENIVSVIQLVEPALNYHTGDIFVNITYYKDDGSDFAIEWQIINGKRQPNPYVSSSLSYLS